MRSAMSDLYPEPEADTEEVLMTASLPSTSSGRTGGPVRATASVTGKPSVSSKSSISSIIRSGVSAVSSLFTTQKRSGEMSRPKSASPKAKRTPPRPPRPKAGRSVQTTASQTSATASENDTPEEAESEEVVSTSEPQPAPLVEQPAGERRRASSRPRGEDLDSEGRSVASESGSHTDTETADAEERGSLASEGFASSLDGDPGSPQDFSSVASSAVSDAEDTTGDDEGYVLSPRGSRRVTFDKNAPDTLVFTPDDHGRTSDDEAVRENRERLAGVGAEGHRPSANENFLQLLALLKERSLTPTSEQLGEFASPSEPTSHVARFLKDLETRRNSREADSSDITEDEEPSHREDRRFAFPSERPSDRRGSFVDTIDEFLHYLEAIAEDHKAHEEAMEMLHNEPQKASATETDSDTASEGGDSVWSDSNSRASDDSDTHASMGNESSSELASVETDADSGLASSPRTEQTSGEDAAPAEDAGDNGKNNELGGRSHDQAPSPGQFELPFDADPDEILAAPGKGAEQPPDTVLMAVSEASQETSPKSDSTMSHGEAQDRSSEEGHGSISNMTTEEDKSEENEANSRIQEKHIPEPDEAIVQSEKLTEENVEINPTPLSSDSLEPETPDALVPEHHTAQQVSSPGASSLNDTMNFHRERPEGESATSELSDSSNALPVITDKTRNPTAPTFPNDTDAEHSAGLSSGTKDVNHSEIGELDTEEIPGPDDDLATLEQSSSTETIRAVNDEERADGAQYTDDIDTSHSVEVTPDLSNRTNSEPGPQETLEAARQVNNEPPPEASLETHPDESLEMHPKEATDSSLEEAPNLPPQEALELPPQEANEVSALGATHPQSQDASTPAQGVSQESNDLSADKRRGTSADQRALRGLLQSSLPQMPAVQVLGTQSADALAERRSLTVATETSDGSLLSVPSSDIQARSPGQVGSLEVVAKSPGEVSQLPSEAPSESELPQHEPVRSLASIADRLLREGSDEEVQAAPSGMGQANSLAAISGQLLTDHSPGELAEPPSAGDEADEERELSTVMMDDGVRPGTTKADAGAEEQSGPSKASAAIGVEDQRRDGGAAAALGVEDQPRDGGAAATLGVEDQPKDGGVVAALGVEDQPGNDRTTVILGLGDQPGDGEASLGPGLSDRPEDGEEAADPETEDQPEESEAAAAIGMERQPRDGDAVARLLREKGDESLKQAIAPIMTSGQRDGDEYETSEASETAESAIDDQKAHEEAMLMLESETQGTLTSEAIHPSTPSTDSGEEYNANQNEKVSRAKPGSDSSAAISGLEVTDPSALVSDGRMYTRQEEVMSGAREANGPVEETDEDMTKRSTDKQAANLTPESTHGTNELIAISSESSVLSDLRSDVSEYATGSEKSAFEEDRDDPVPVIDENNAPMTDHGDSTHAEETGAGLGVQGHKTSAQKMVWSLITMASGIVEQMQGSKIVISPSKIGFRNADEQTNLPAKEGSGSASKGVLSEKTKSTPKALENLPPRSMSQIVHDEITKEAKKSNISMTQLKHAYSDTINRIVADAQNQVVKAAQGLVGAVLKTSSGRLHDVQNHEDAGVENKTSSEQSGQSTNSSDHEESNSIENDDLPVSDEKSAPTDTSEEVQDGSLPKHQSDVTVSRISQVKVASKTSALGGRTSAVKHSKGNLENSRIIQEDNRKTNWEPPSPQDIANIAVAITQSVLDAASRIADDENELDRKSRVKASILHLKKGNKIKVQPRPASKTAPNQRENSISNMEGDTEFLSDENQQAELPSDENEDAELPSDTVGENPDAELRADENAIPELSPGENVGAALTPDENADDNLPPDQGAVSEQSPDESADAELPPGENATEELAPDEPPDENADAEWAPDESAHVDVPTTENSNQDLSMEEKQDSGLPPDDNLASDLAPNEQTAELPSDEELSDLPPTDSQDASLAPTESQDAALAPTESQDAALPPTESQDAALTPIESQDAALPPTESQDAALLPPESQDVALPLAESQDASLPFTESGDATLPPADSQDAALPPAESQDVAPPLTENQNATLLPAESQDAALPPADSQDAALPPADSQDVALLHSENQDAAPSPTESQETAPPPTESQEAAAPLVESQDVVLPPTESQDNAPPFTESQDTAPPSTESQDAALPSTGSSDAALASAESQDAALPSMESQDASLPTAESQDAALSPSGSQDAALPPAESQDAALPPAESQDAALPPAESGSAALADEAPPLDSSADAMVDDPDAIAAMGSLAGADSGESHLPLNTDNLDPGDAEADDQDYGGAGTDGLPAESQEQADAAEQKWSDVPHAEMYAEGEGVPKPEEEQTPTSTDETTVSGSFVDSGESADAMDESLDTYDATRIRYEMGEIADQTQNVVSADAITSQMLRTEPEEGAVTIGTDIAGQAERAASDISDEDASPSDSLAGQDKDSTDPVTESNAALDNGMKIAVMNETASDDPLHPMLSNSENLGTGLLPPSSLKRQSSWLEKDIVAPDMLAMKSSGSTVEDMDAFAQKSASAVKGKEGAYDADADADLAMAPIDDLMDNGDETEEEMSETVTETEDDSTITSTSHDTPQANDHQIGHKTAGPGSDANVFDWLRRVSTQMDEMGITDQLKEKYGDDPREVLVEKGPQGAQASAEQSSPKTALSDTGMYHEQSLSMEDAYRIRQSSTQTDVKDDDVVSRRRPPLDYGVGARRAPCGCCPCCLAMKRVVSGAARPGDGRTSPRKQLAPQRPWTSPARSVGDLLDDTSSMTVSTGTASSEEGGAYQRRMRNPKKWLKEATDEFMRRECIRQVVLKNDLVAEGRTRTKVTRISRHPSSLTDCMAACGGRVPATQSLQMEISKGETVVDGRTVNYQDVKIRTPKACSGPPPRARRTTPSRSCQKMAKASGGAERGGDPVKRFVDTYLGNSRSGKADRDGKETKSRKKITIRTDCRK